MHALKLFIVLIFVAMIASCGEDQSPTAIEPNEKFETQTAIGVIKNQSLSSYMYGTHRLCENCGNTKYALQSTKINLDNYIDKTVRIEGELVAGYPVDGGPKLIEITNIMLIAIDPNGDDASDDNTDDGKL